MGYSAFFHCMRSLNACRYQPEYGGQAGNGPVQLEGFRTAEAGTGRPGHEGQSTLACTLPSCWMGMTCLGGTEG
eukprot:3904760-Rhodomonas_salina.4